MLITNAGTFEGTFDMHPQKEKNTKKVYYVLERETEIKRPRIDLQIIFCCSAVTFIVPIIRGRIKGGFIGKDIGSIRET